MSNFDVLTMALRNLFKRKTRTFLTVLGVIISYTSFVLIFSMSIAQNDSFNEQMKNIQDALLIQIYNWNGYNGVPDAPVLDNAVIAEMKNIENVTTATPYMSYYMCALSGRYQAQFEVVGIDPEAMPFLGYKLKEGAYIDANDPYSFVFGADVPYNFQSQGGGRISYDYGWGPQSQQERVENIDIMKDKIQVSPDYSLIQSKENNNTQIQDNGEYVPDPVFSTVDQSIYPPFEIKTAGRLDGTDYQTSQTSYINIKTMTQILNDYAKWQEKEFGYKQPETFGYQMAYVKCDSVKDVSKVAETIKEYGFEVYYATESVDALKKTAESTQFFLILLGFITAVLAVIGIANTMITATMERTKEIGIMKVIGAALKDVTKLFLFEAAIIGLFGGIMGAGLSYLVSYIFNNFDLPFLQMVSSVQVDPWNPVPIQEFPISIITPYLTALAIPISAAVGLVAGLFPTIRATKISALTAIRSN